MRVVPVQRVLFSDMAINQCQNGVDDEVEVPQEVFAQERFKLGKKGSENLYDF